MADNTKVQYRRLGKSGLRVSVPILGAMSFGSKKWAPWVIEEAEAFKLLEAAWDRGLTTWDTANIYSNGESERIIGKFLKQKKIPRSQVVILTKCFNLVTDDPGVMGFMHPELNDTRRYVNQSGLSRAAIFNAVEESLERLDTHYIDLLQIHRFDRDTDPEEIMKALHDLVQSGKVRYIGASSMWAWQFAMLQEVAEKKGWTKFISMQGEHSLLYREEEREMNPYCNYNGIGLIPWAPLAAGMLARPYDPNATGTVRNESAKGGPFEQKHSDADQEIVKRVEEVAKKKGWKMSQVALAWSCAKVSSPIVGFSSAQRMDEAIIPGHTLTEEEMKYLEQPYVPKPTRGFS